MPSPDLSAIVLCYRAGHNVRRVVQPLYDDLCALEVPFELVLVANYEPGTDDATPEAVQEFGRTHDRVVAVAEPKRGGMGWDMAAGFKAASGNYMVVIDGDEQNPVEDLLESYRQMKRRELDVVKGRRIARFDGYFRHLTSIVYNALFLVMFRTNGLWDVNGKPKGLTRDAYERLDLHANDWFIDAEIVIQAARRGMRIGEIPVVFRQNMERRSFVRPGAVLEFVRNMARYRFGGR
jgi:glycosyltransferase involved in cell wall biosynthesis